MHQFVHSSFLICLPISFIVSVSNICSTQLVMHRTKEDELEELRLREELKLIDAALKKNKKVHYDFHL